MNQRVKIIEEEDYQTCCKWWAHHGWTPLPKSFLPKRGYIAFIDDVPVFAGWLFKDETAQWAMFEWMVTNPEVHGESRASGFKALCDKVFEVCAELEVKHLMTSTNNDGLEKRLNQVGFEVSDPNMRFMIRNF